MSAFTQSSERYCRDKGPTEESSGHWFTNTAERRSPMSVKFYILARPQFTEAYQAFVKEFLPQGDDLWHEMKGPTPAERLVEFAGRICYMSFGSRQSPSANAEYIRELISNEHDSVLEHFAWTVAYWRLTSLHPSTCAPSDWFFLQSAFPTISRRKRHAFCAARRACTIPGTE
jgi:Thymidylate synthase complementing protein